MRRVCDLTRLILVAFLSFNAITAFAQTWPTKPIRLIVPMLPGGGLDTIGRAFAQKFSEVWKQPVVVDNRTGAGGVIGADVVAKAPADGYTFLINSTSQASSAAIYRRLPFDAVKDFAPVTQIISTYFLMVSNPRLPVSNVKDLIALAKSQPGKLNMGSSGTGTSPHLVGELLRLETGIDVVHVPYKGDAELQPAIMNGEIQFTFFPPNSALQYVKSGRMRALAVTGSKRGSAAPDVPTISEAGIPNFEFNGWVGFFAPAGTPSSIVQKVSAETARLLRTPDILERVPSWGGEAAGTSPEEFTARYRSDVAKFIRIVKEARVPVVD